MARNAEDFSALEIASSLLIVKNLGPRLCEIDHRIFIGKKGLSRKFEDSSGCQGGNQPLPPPNHFAACQHSSP